MTEAERQTKIALTLKRMAAELLQFVQGTAGAEADEIRLWVRQLSTLSNEFGSGRYLPREPDATAVVDDAPVAGAQKAP